MKDAQHYMQFQQIAGKNIAYYCRVAYYMDSCDQVICSHSVEKAWTGWIRPGWRPYTN